MYMKKDNVTIIYNLLFNFKRCVWLKQTLNYVKCTNFAFDAFSLLVFVVVFRIQTKWKFVTDSTLEMPKWSLLGCSGHLLTHYNTNLCRRLYKIEQFLPQYDISETTNSIVQNIAHTQLSDKVFLLKL